MLPPPHSSSLSPSLPPLPLFIPMLLSLLSEAISRAVGQAERDDNAMVIGRETNDCGKEKRREEKRREEKRREEKRREEKRREEKRREEKRREEKRREEKRREETTVIWQTEVAVDIRYKYILWFTSWVYRMRAEGRQMAEMFHISYMSHNTCIWENEMSQKKDTFFFTFL